MTRKKSFKVFMLTLLMLMAFAFSQTALAKDIKINNGNFPDEVFRTYVSTKCDTNQDGILQESEIEATTHMLFDWKHPCADMKGLEYFTSLKKLELYCATCKILDVSNNTALTSLKISNSEIEKVNLSKNLALTEFDCSGAKLSTIDLSNNLTLTSLDCSCTPLTSLDVSKNIKLKKLDCGYTNIASLNLSNNENLLVLDCEYTKLTSLDISKNKKLKELHCSDTQISSLNLKYCTKLKILDCQKCNLASLDVSNCGLLTELTCLANKLTSLKLDKNPELTTLDCSENKLTSLNLQYNTKLSWIIFDKNRLSKVDVSATEVFKSRDGYSTEYPIALIGYPYGGGLPEGCVPCDVYMTAKQKDNLLEAMAGYYNLDGDDGDDGACFPYTADDIEQFYKSYGYTLKIAKFSSAKLTSTSYTYNGKVKTPSVTVKNNAGSILKKGRDYTVSYATGRAKVGKYKVTVKGIGNYRFTKYLYFKIRPPKTSISRLTPGTKSFTVKWYKRSYQVKGYEVQYSTSRTFASGRHTVKITSYATTSKRVKSLAARKKYYVRVRTYKIVKDVKYYSLWSDKKYVTTK